MNPKNSQDLFNKIRSQFSNIRLGDENGAATADPSSAVFFEFEFQEDADTFGSVSVSIADGNTMKVFYNRNLVDKIDEDSKGEWYAFLKELKDFAVEHQLRFDVRDITKNNLTKQDYENLADTNKTVNTDGMSEELNRITKLAGVEKAPVAEGLTGTSKSSFENLNKTKLIIRHKGKVDETVPGARSRQIQSLYIENEEGERFKYPLTHLAGARAMQRHVSNGGRPHDEFGQHIVSTSEDIAKLNSFSRYASNKDQLNDNAGDIIEQTKLKLENLRGYMRNISKQAHYEAAAKDFKTSEEQVLDDETVNKLREKFTMKNLDSRVEDAFPIINKIMSELDLKDLKPKASDVITYGKGGSLKYIQIEYEILGTLENMLINNSEQEVLKRIADFVTDEVGEEHVDKAMEIIQKAKENKDEEMTFDDMIEQLKGKKEEQVNELDPGDEPIDAPIQAPVDHGAVVQSFLTDPENKLVLRKDDSADKMLKVTKFKDKNTMLGSILSDIASRLLTKSGEEDRVANFASRVADGIEQEGSNSFKPGPDYNSNKKIAVQLAKRYIDDYKKMQQDPAYADEVRMDPADFNPKKDIKGKAIGKETEAFESWVEETVNEYATAPKDPELEKKDKENANKLDVTKADKMMNTTAYKKMKSGDDRYTDKTEGMGGVNENPETDYEGSMDYELSGDDGEMAYGTIHYKAINGVVDPNSLQGSYEYNGNHKIDNDVADEMIKPGGEEHEEALKAAQEDYDYEVGRMKSKYGGNQLEGLTFEDIKPYVSMYKDKDGKIVNAVLDKDGAEVFKTHDGKAAMAYLSQNYDKLKKEDSEVQDEAEEINTELDRIKHLANIQ
jgi:hypothetical protein